MRLGDAGTLLAAAVFFGVLGHAEAATPVLQPQPPPRIYDFHLRLTLPQAQMVGRALQELPYKDAMPILVSMQAELNAQNVPPPKPKRKP